MKTINLIITFLFITSAVFAQNTQEQIDAIFYKAYISNSELHWKAGLQKLEALYAGKEDPQSLFEVAKGKYGLLNSTMATKNEDLFDQQLDPTLELLDKIIELRPECGEPYALYSAILGLQMGYSPWKGVYLGPKSGNMMEKALKLGSQSPLVWKIEASGKLFTPSMWGGDVNKAVEAYEKAISIYENSGENLQNHWIYLDALAFMGQAYSKAGNNAKAIETYEKALKIEPEFYWVKKHLLPSIASND